MARSMRRRGAIAQEDDKRMLWFEERVCISLGVSAENFKMMLLNKECKNAILGFMDETNHSAIIFDLHNLHQGQEGVTSEKYLQCSEIGLPNSPKFCKAICFLKEKRDLKVPFHDVGNEIMFIEISHSIPISLLYTLKGSLFPMLTRSLSMKGLTNSSIKGFGLACDEFLYALEIFSERMSGCVTLPLPTVTMIELASMVSSDSRDLASTRRRETMASIEACVLTWLKQMRLTLAKDPGEELNAVEEKFPSFELNFWAARSAELDGILGRMRNQISVKIVKLMETNNSSYFDALSTTIHSLELKAVEARKNLKYLGLFRPYFEIVEDPSLPFRYCEDTAFENTQWACAVKSIFHLLYLITVTPQCKRISLRFALMIQQLSNLTISRSYQLMDLHGNRLSLVLNTSHSLNNLLFAIQACRALKTIFDGYADKFSLHSQSSYKEIVTSQPCIGFSQPYLGFSHSCFYFCNGHNGFSHDYNSFCRGRNGFCCGCIGFCHGRIGVV